MIYRIVETVLAAPVIFAAILQTYNSGWWRGSQYGNGWSGLATFVMGVTLVSLVWTY